MIDAAEFDYAQARLQARHSARLNEAAWSTIDAAVTLGQFVENIRATALAPFLDFCRSTTSAHEAEQALRSAWRRSVFEAARWAPGAWQPAVQWLASATELSVLIHLLRGEPPLDWLKTDPVWHRALEAQSAAQATASTPAPSFSLREQLVGIFSQLSFEEPLAPALVGNEEPAADHVRARAPTSASVIDAWVEEWRSRWPRTDTDTRHALEALIAVVRRHIEEMRAAESAAAARALRHDLRLRLTHSLHVHARTPVALIAHVLLMALDFERLRDGLIRRIVGH